MTEYCVKAIHSEDDVETITHCTGFKAAKRAAYHHARASCNRQIDDLPPQAPSALGWLREAPGRWTGEYDDTEYSITQQGG